MAEEIPYTSLIEITYNTRSRSTKSNLCSHRKEHNPQDEVKCNILYNLPIRYGAQMKI